MAQQHRQQDELYHVLSRIALAKAIKTPDNPQSEEEPWQKSVIFNQPFIKQLQNKRQQQLNSNTHRHKKTEQKRPSPSPLSATRNKPLHKNIASTEKTLSKLSIQKPVETKVTNQRSCLPSDSEEEDEDEEEEELSDEEEDSNGSEIIQVVKKSQSNSTFVRSRPESMTSTRDSTSSPSRGSTSSHTLPLTDEDDVVESSTPNAALHHSRSNSSNWTLPEQQQQQQQQQKMPYSNNRYSTMDMMDPMYYQRYQQYQQQLQFQYQQQAIALQQQQQQLYMLSQSPSAFFPPNARVIAHEEPKRQTNRRNSNSKLSQTDIRRRAEMLRSTKDVNRLSQPSKYYPQQQPMTPPPVIKSNNRRPSYNL